MPLPKKFIDKQKKILASERDRLVAEIENLKKYPDYGERGDDNTLELIDFETNLSIEENLAKTLTKVNVALKAIEKGTYGRCSKCRELIEAGRLKSMPYAELCITCRNKTK